MIELQHKNAFFLLANADYQQLDYPQFFHIDYWQQQQRILGSASGRGTTWFLRSQDLFGVNTALRHYYRGGLWGKLVRDRYQFSYLAKTRSFQEFSLLHKLHQAGLAVPKPIAAKVEKNGWSYRADILLEKIENAQDLTALLQQQSLAKTVWQQIGRLIRALHNMQICHTDLNAHNILVQQQNGEEKCWLIDFDKCGEKSGDFWKIQNLERLQRSFYKEVQRMGIKFEQQNWQDLLAAYHNPEI